MEQCQRKTGYYRRPGPLVEVIVPTSRMVAPLGGRNPDTLYLL